MNARLLFAAASLASLASCTGVVAPLGLSEPIRLHDATLQLGALPSGNDGEGPAVTSIESAGGIWGQGQLDRRVAGRVDETAFAVGLQLADLGTGWWTVPVDGVDPSFPGERTWGVKVDVGGGVPVGLHAMRVVAIDEEGRAGPPSEMAVCIVDRRVPDGLNACDPELPPPAAVVVLEWDSDVDLDLVLTTPELKTVDARHPTTASTPDGTVPPDRLADPTVGRLDGDSNAECVTDGRNSESVTWREAPQPGLYNVYANLFDACGAGSVRFAVTVYRRETLEDGTFRLARGESTTGSMLAPSANGGAGQPLYVTTASF